MLVMERSGPGWGEVGKGGGGDVRPVHNRISPLQEITLKGAFNKGGVGGGAEVNEKAGGRGGGRSTGHDSPLWREPLPTFTEPRFLAFSESSGGDGSPRVIFLAQS